MKPHRGTLILVFGIISLVACAPFGFFAWMMGNNDLREIDSGLMDPSGRPNTSAGRICGIIGSILFFVQLVFLVIMMAAMGAGVFAAMKEAEKNEHMTPELPTPVESPR
jgi:hypothetical protein